MVIDGEYVILKDEVRQERAMALLELEEAGEHCKAVRTKIRTTVDQLAELATLFRSAAFGMESEKTYRRQMFEEHLAKCTECLDRGVLKGLIVALDAANDRQKKVMKRLKPDEQDIGLAK